MYPWPRLSDVVWVLVLPKCYAVEGREAEVSISIPVTDKQEMGAVAPQHLSADRGPFFSELLSVNLYH